MKTIPTLPYRIACATAAIMLGAGASLLAQCWEQGPAAPSGLNPRKGHAMAFHSGTGHVVMFGGYDGGTTYDDTWEYDGTWTQGGFGPPGRSGHRMAYDSSRGVVVMFGGVDGGGIFYDDTWEYDGFSWRQGASPDPILFPRAHHAMAYDSNRQVVVLYGGHDAAYLFDDTWELSGAGWSQGASAFEAKSHHAMAYDANRRRIVVFGGDEGGGVVSNETMEYDGSNWYSGPSAPPGLNARANHSMAYDATTGRVVMFGGWDVTTYFNDTWEYNGSSWQQDPAAPAGLTPRVAFAMAYDDRRSKVVLFAGQDQADETDDTWEYPGPCCPTITLSPATLPSGVVSVPYSQTIAASGGAAPYTFSIASGALPAGLTLSASGVLSGTPSASGSFVFTVQVTDAAGCPGSRIYTLVIAACNITISPAALPGGSVGVAYAQIVTASGGAQPYTYTVTLGALPLGLTLSTAGLISGSPVAAGTFGFTVTATDATGCSGSRAYAITIVGAGGTTENIIAGQGLGAPNPNRVRVYRQDGTATTVDFLAYTAGQWGVNVAGGNATGGTTEQIFTGPGPGPVYAPQVRGFLSSGSAMAKVNYYAYGTLRYGVNVVAAELDNDGFDELATGAGPGAVFGPHVRGWGYDNTTITAIAKISYFAYGTLKYGVNVGSGSVDADAYAEILTAPGPGAAFGPQVRGWNYDNVTLTSIGKINFNAFSSTQYGANVAGGDVEGDGFDEIAAAPGPGFGPTFPPRFRGFDYDGTAITSIAGYDVTLPIVASYGGRVGLGDVTGDGPEDLLAGAGRDPSVNATVRPYVYVGGQLGALLTFNPFTGSTYGVNVAGGDLGY